MKFWPMAVAVSLALVAGCDRRPTTPPSPKTDISSATPQAAAGSSTTPANTATPTTAEKREGSNPVQGQVDPKSGAQHRDFQQRGEGAGPSSSDTKPTMKN
ncbi:MAG TPA: hypothetical protein VEQ87_06830 [Burkholderiales bacterium]|nr:hypothetical protein [Burkholderiales bacterium]